MGKRVETIYEPSNAITEGSCSARINPKVVINTIDGTDYTKLVFKNLTEDVVVISGAGGKRSIIELTKFLVETIADWK